MSVIKSFSEYKCNKCDSNGFIVKDGKAVMCECRSKYEYEVNASNLLLNSGLLTKDSTYEDLKKLIDYDFKDYRGKDENGNIKRIKKYVDEFDNINKPFKHLHCYVYGGQGTQKSYTLRGMLAKLACKGKNVYYIFTRDLIDLLIDSERNEEAEKKLNYILNVDCLVLDEFDSERIVSWKSNYKEEMLIVPLKRRMEVIRKSTWIISNYSLEEQNKSSFANLYYDLLCRECKFGMFNFKDRYFDCLSKEEIEEKLNSIWGD